MAKRIRISSERLNCYGTWVKTDGVNLEQFQKNPVLLWMHERGLIVGCVKDLRVEGGDITGEPFFDEVREESKLLKEQYDKGTLKMCSANFDVLELSEDPALLKPGQTRPTVTKSKLCEVSMVDIGGNDDAHVLLSYQDKALKLTTDEACLGLPLLKTNGGGIPHPTNQKTENEMELKAIALKLGLPETAGETEILSSIDILCGYKEANETLRKEKEQLQLAGITSLVDEACAAGKFTADKKGHFIELGKKTGAESLKLTLDAMAMAVKPMDLIGKATGLRLAGTGEWTKLSEVSSGELMELRNTDRDTYMKLYKAEYGVECPKY